LCSTDVAVVDVVGEMGEVYDAMVVAAVDFAGPDVVVVRTAGDVVVMAASRIANAERLVLI
jgi:hypothetical protein